MQSIVAGERCIALVQPTKVNNPLLAIHIKHHFGLANLEPLRSLQFGAWQSMHASLGALPPTSARL